MDYYVDVDITMSKRIFVRASSEEEARAKAVRLISKEPAIWAGSGKYVNHKISETKLVNG